MSEDIRLETRRVLPELDETALDKLCRYYELMVETNKEMNLTAITDAAEVAEKHFLDSLLPLEFDLIPKNARLIDVGAGAGLPGIPLAVVRPDIRLTMLDSLNKRVGFLQSVTTELGIDAKCIHARAEDAGRHPDKRAQYDVAVARAVAPLPVLIELTLPFLCVGGTLIAYKGPGAAQEIQDSERALELMFGEVKTLEKENSYGYRMLVVVKKLRKTPQIYPRRAGTPSKSPL